MKTKYLQESKMTLHEQCAADLSVNVFQQLLASVKKTLSFRALQPSSRHKLHVIHI